MEPTEKNVQGRVAWDTSGATTVHANVFHVASGREEVVLLFGRSAQAVSFGDEERLEFKERVVMSPFAAKRFAMQLQNAVRSYELAYGPLDREPTATEEPTVDQPEMADPKARLLLDLVGKLDVMYGLERSFKVFKKTLLANRFLVTMTKDSIRSEPGRRLLDICSQIHMPGNFIDLYKENLSFAKYVHFGFEENEKSSTYKAYLEFPPNWETEILNKPAGSGSFLLYLGFKWDAGDNQKHALTRYTCYPLIPVENIHERLSNLYDGPGQKDTLEITKGIVETALGRIRYDKILYLEVTEDNNPRRSFDINMYRAKLRLEELLPHLLAMCRHFSIPPERFHAIFDPMRSRRFGHLSGGIDREGKDFLTVYYGVEGYRKGYHNHP